MGWVFLCECLFAYAMNINFLINVKWECANDVKVSAFYFGLRFKKSSDLLEWIFIALLVVAPGKVRDEV
jgi:hypothetical protein